MGGWWGPPSWTDETGSLEAHASCDDAAIRRSQRTAWLVLLAALTFAGCPDSPRWPEQHHAEGR